MNHLHKGGAVMLLNIDFFICTFVVVFHSSSRGYVLVCICMWVCMCFFHFSSVASTSSSKSWPHLIWQPLPAHMLLSEGWSAGLNKSRQHSTARQESAPYISCGTADMTGLELATVSRALSLISQRQICSKTTNSLWFRCWMWRSNILRYAASAEGFGGRKGCWVSLWKDVTRIISYV